VFEPISIAAHNTNLIFAEQADSRVHPIFTAAGPRGRTVGSMESSGIDSRLGLNVPHEWWPAAALLKEKELFQRTHRALGVREPAAAER